jgi:hypothetical protein
MIRDPSLRFRRPALLLALAGLAATALPAPADAAILSFFGFGFSKNKYYKEALYWVDSAGNVLGLAGVIAPPAASVGAVLKTGAMIARVIDPTAMTILSGRATIQLSPGETFVQAGWYGEFGANPLLPAPPVGSATIDELALQEGCNPLMVSCSASYNASLHQTVLEFDWGQPGFTPSLNLDAGGHFNFAAVYTLAPNANAPFGMLGTRADVAAMGTNAPTYMLCNTGYCGNVPEPESWGMVILGLALVGGVMRRRGGGSLEGVCAAKS